ncbi:MAG: glycosyltransferase [Phycisphaerae bacterium]|nr:glycosyltransferase [Phycisphaerae bacterium]
MRILMVAHSNATWTPDFGRFFVERGDALKIVSVAPDKIPGLDVAFVGIEPFDPFKNKHMFFTRVPRIRRIIRAFQPDVVFAPYLASNGLSAALSWKGPLAVCAVGGDVLEQVKGPRLRRCLRETLVRFVCWRSDLIHSVSQGITDELVRLGVTPAKIIQFPIGMDPKRFCPAPGMPRAEGTRFVAIRKHEPVYDNATIIRALGRLRAKGRTFHCTIACNGSLLDDHKAQAREAGLDDAVSFTGNLPREQVVDTLRQADVYVSASLSDGTSVALLEAMAVGLTPVVSRIPANESWVDHGRTGLLFTPGDADDLASALETAIDDAELRRRAFETNRALVESQGNMHQSFARLAEAFERLVSG